jgi:hypothetical protein
MKRKQTTTSLALFGMALLATVMTTSISYATPASALSHFNKPNGLADFGGLPMSDKTTDFGGLLDKDGASSGFPEEGKRSSLIDGLPVNGKTDDTAGGDGNTFGGSPNDEMNAANTREQGGSDAIEDRLTHDGEAADGGSDNSKGNMDSDRIGYEEFQGCLSEFGGDGSPTEQEVQECMESAYSGTDNSESTPTGSTDDGDEEENGVTEHVSADDSEAEDEEDEDSEDSEE